MLKLHLCLLVFLLHLCDTLGYTYKSTAATTAATSAPQNGGGSAGVYSGSGSGTGCGACPFCPIGYETTRRDYSCECLCRYTGGGLATATATPYNSLLIRILSNIGNNAESISQMAQSLKDELQLAQELV